MSDNIFLILYLWCNNYYTNGKFISCIVASDMNNPFDLTQGFLVLFKFHALIEFVSVFHLSGEILAQLKLGVMFPIDNKLCK